MVAPEWRLLDPFAFSFRTLLARLLPAAASCLTRREDEDNYLCLFCRIQMGRRDEGSQESRQLFGFEFFLRAVFFILFLMLGAGHSVMGSANIRSFANAKPNALWWAGGQTTTDVRENFLKEILLEG